MVVTSKGRDLMVDRYEDSFGVTTPLQLNARRLTWREFFTPRRQRSRVVVQTVMGERVTEPWTCKSARPRSWAAKAAGRTLNSSSQWAMRRASRVLLARWLAASGSRWETSRRQPCDPASHCGTRLHACRGAHRHPAAGSGSWAGGAAGCRRTSGMSVLECHPGKHRRHADR